ncbi:CAT RNA binding domain-containing protein [Peptidiphaga sp.]|uniref:CAT RNA binding domain-containing protein n=1 Tax=Peptidiphaga sp. TaxID=2848648 RepID=UPI003622BCA1
MRISAVFNNDVVLARDELGRETVLTGRGLGFRAHPGIRPRRTGSSGASSRWGTPPPWRRCSPRSRRSG